MIINIDYAIAEITEQIINKFDPKAIILFGSIAKGTYNLYSDIDLCIIKDTLNKRDLIMRIQTEIDSKIPFDILVYTNDEWERNVNDPASFAYIINNTGVILYG